MKISQRYSQIGKTAGDAKSPTNGSGSGSGGGGAEPASIAMTDISVAVDGGAAPAANGSADGGGDAKSDAPKQLSPSAAEKAKPPAVGDAGPAAPPLAHKKSFIVMRGSDTLTVFDNAQKSIFGLMERYKCTAMHIAVVLCCSVGRCTDCSACGCVMLCCVMACGVVMRIRDTGGRINTQSF